MLQVLKLVLLYLFVGFTTFTLAYLSLYGALCLFGLDFVKNLYGIIFLYVFMVFLVYTTDKTQ